MKSVRRFRWSGSRHLRHAAYGAASSLSPFTTVPLYRGLRELLGLSTMRVAYRRKTQTLFVLTAFTVLCTL